MISDRRQGMKTWRLLLGVVMAVAALLLMTSLVVAAPASTDGVQAYQAHGHPGSILTGTLPMTHPVGIAIALHFNIPYTQVMALRDEGLGFGTIARVYVTAYASHGTLTPEQVLNMHRAGASWGQIKRDYGVHPGGNGLGSIMGNQRAAPQPGPAASAPPQEVKPGNNDAGCPGNSCNAPGQQKPPKAKPDRAPKN
jgi:hypothetical protein